MFFDLAQIGTHSAAKTLLVPAASRHYVVIARRDKVRESFLILVKVAERTRLP